MAKWVGVVRVSKVDDEGNNDYEEIPVVVNALSGTQADARVRTMYRNKFLNFAVNMTREDAVARGIASSKFNSENMEGEIGRMEKERHSTFKGLQGILDDYKKEHKPKKKLQEDTTSFGVSPRDYNAGRMKGERKLKLHEF